jgi:preprotein translocase subunit SecF
MLTHQNMIRVIKHRRIWFIFSGILTVISVAVLGFWGLKYGIDFTGGSLLELNFPGNRPDNQELIGQMASLELGSVTAQPLGDQEMLLRFKNVDEPTHQKILSLVKKQYSVVTDDATIAPNELRFESIGPAVGQELKEKTVWAIVFSLIGMIAYISWAFRKVSKPVSSWKFGLFAIIALFHDVLITIGVFVLLGHFYNVEVNAPFVAALLTVLGYSINDTIVVFDRIRENLLRRSTQDFETIVEESINQTFVRSINTSMTVLLTLFAIFMFGGESIRDFALALLIGISFGTYSSIFLASPMLVAHEHYRTKRPS